MPEPQTCPAGEAATGAVGDLLAAGLDVAALPGSTLGKVADHAKRLYVAAEVEVARRAAEDFAEHARLAGAADTSPGAKLRWVAAARRTYLDGMPADMRRLVELQVDTLEMAARIVEGDLEPLYGLLPSWLWTDQMHAALNGEPPFDAASGTADAQMPGDGRG